ncbi:hypothetical protein [Legionella hackeliae]|uniref:Rho GTPase (Miro-like) n=1 Tax=Legionella hackeliae TaxID=449 RepID=A0A0A8UUF3_LEGHA|nr:hypothetical protein [Legionella hackeliae]KTD14209.1 Rho GTPase (Miro-like) [Legionella hackeliae]CEK10419.1 membrane protein of unknown function [Legionella hackeliae]STX47154.1 Rho GTPase (Miro-like) [Legionella hackeliae]
MAVIFFGSEKAGTKLIHSIQNHFNIQPGVVNFDERAVYTTTVQGLSITFMNPDPRFKCMWNIFCPDQVGFFCLELSEADVNYQEIIAQIQLFKRDSNFSDVVLVGIPDKDYKGNPQEKLCDIRETLSGEKVYTKKAFAISNQDDISKFVLSLNALEQEAASEAAEDEEFFDANFSPWQMAVVNLKGAIRNLPYKKFNAISAEINSLQTKLAQEDTSGQAQAIQAFSQNCHQILEGKHPHILNSVLILAAVALVTVIVGAIGFGIGFAAGVWSGPGAFFTGIVGGAAFAKATVAASASLGLFSGGLAAYGLFNSSKEEKKAVDNFVSGLSIS